MEEARSAAPSGTEKLSQGQDEFLIDFTFDTDSADDTEWAWTYSCGVSWDDLLYDVGPVMLNEATDIQSRRAFNESVRRRSTETRCKDKKLNGHKRPRNVAITDHDFQTIKIQLRALGFDREESVVSPRPNSPPARLGRLPDSRQRIADAHDDVG